MIAHLDCSTGISGDKFLGALIDAGFDRDRLGSALGPLGIPSEDVLIERTISCSIAAVTVRLSSEADDAVPPVRHLAEIRDLIAKAELADAVAERALSVFQLLAESESRVHGVGVEEVHFHEIGADDTILDVVGVALGLADLGIDHLVCTPIAVGAGTVTCSHGVLPIPAPATAQLLLGVPTVPGPSLASNQPAGELTTPTGAALVRFFASEFGPMPPMVPRAIGYGAGTRDLGFPNVARIVVGESADVGGVVGSDEGEMVRSEVVTVLETNLDHLTPEQLAFAAEELLNDGALDVWQTPIVMKKGRAAVLLSVLCEPSAADTLASRVHELTGTLGVRRSDVTRSVLPREERSISTRYGPVRVKIARVGGEDRPRPEHEEIARIARETGSSIFEISKNIADDVAAGVFLE